MERRQNVTLEEAYELVKQRAFARWSTRGNYMNVKIPIKGENVETIVFLGDSIFIVGLSVEKEGLKVMGSRVDFIDIWPSVKAKYPQLFHDGLKGDLCLTP